MSNIEALTFGLLNEPFYAQNILRLVFPYLTKHEKLICARVCRLWYEVAANNDVYASLSFVEKDFVYHHLFQRMKYWDTKHLTLKLCHSVDTQTSNFTFYCIPLPRLKSLHIEECCDYIIKFLISMCPNLEELKVKTRLFSTLTCQRLELNTTHRCLEYTPSQIPWSISIRATDTIKSIKYLSLTYSPMAQYYTQLMELCVNISKLDLVCFSYWNPTKLLNFDKLVTLNLIYCNLDENLEQVLSQCSNLKYLTIVPFYKYELFDALHSNSIILKCAHRLGHSLKRFIWGFSADYLEEAGKLYAGFPQRGFNPPGRTNIDRIPIILNVSQPNFQQIPFVEIELLENYLRQQNWTASVRICKMFKTEIYRF